MARRRQQLRFAIGAGTVAAAVLAFVLLGDGGDAGEGASSPARSPSVGGDLHSLVTDPATPGRAFVGGHDRVAVSIDGGRTWQHVPSLDGADAMGWAFAGDRILVGGHPGLFVSEDGGRTFTKRNDGLPASDLHALGSSPDGSVLYAASPAVGVFVSEDGGRTWDVRSDQAGQSFMGRILVDPDNPDRAVAPDARAGALESTDGGRTWGTLGGVPGTMWVSWDPENVAHVIVSGSGGAFESGDGGKTWEPLDVPDGVTVIEIMAGEPDTLLGAAHSGSDAVIWISTDGGRNWTTNQSNSG